jgi:hypothetical protein
MGCCINPSNRGAAYLADNPVIPVFKHPVRRRPSPIEDKKPEKSQLSPAEIK